MAWDAPITYTTGMHITAGMLNDEVGRSRQMEGKIAELERRLASLAQSMPNSKPGKWEYKKPGRKTDPVLDAAFDKMSKEELTQREAREWFFEQVGITVSDKGAVDAFNQAMRRRRNKM
jgi:hypothetical protein